MVAQTSKTENHYCMSERVCKCGVSMHCDRNGNHNWNPRTKEHKNTHYCKAMKEWITDHWD